MACIERRFVWEGTDSASNVIISDGGAPRCRTNP